MELSGLGGVEPLLGVVQAEEVDVGYLWAICTNYAEKLSCLHWPCLPVPVMGQGPQGLSRESR